MNDEKSRGITQDRNLAYDLEYHSENTEGFDAEPSDPVNVLSQYPFLTEGFVKYQDQFFDNSPAVSETDFGIKPKVMEEGGKSYLSTKDLNKKQDNGKTLLENWHEEFTTLQNKKESGERLYPAEEKLLESFSKFFTRRTGMAEGGSVEKEMSSFMGNVDPVSGNEIPPGGTAEGVRDDVPANLSEGEFVIRENAVNFYGQEFFEFLQDYAEKMYGSGKAEGSVDEEEDQLELPFDPSELESVEVDDVEGFAEGGFVTDDSWMDYDWENPDNNTTSAPTMVPYILPDGGLRYIPTVDGKPQTPVPPGATLYEGFGGPGQGAQVERPKTSADAPGGGQGYTEEQQHALAKDPTDWSPSDIRQYAGLQQTRASGDERQQVQDAFVRSMVSMIPMGGKMLDMRQRRMAGKTPEIIDQMLESGVDQQGNPLTPEDVTMLEESKSILKETEDVEQPGFGDIISKRLGIDGIFEDVKDSMKSSFGVGDDDDNMIHESQLREGEVPDEGTVIDMRDRSTSSDEPTRYNEEGQVTSTPAPPSNPHYRRGGLVSRRK